MDENPWVQESVNVNVLLTNAMTRSQHTVRTTWTVAWRLAVGIGYEEEAQECGFTVIKAGWVVCLAKHDLDLLHASGHQTSECGTTYFDTDPMPNPYRNKPLE